MSREALLELLQARIGLDPGTLGQRVLDDAFADARRALAVADDEALLRKVQPDADAFAEFAESFVVPETWFFRAADQFRDLARFAREQPTRRPLRVLSLPASTGEEAYSAAITLLEAGLAPADIDVLGIDISPSAIKRAAAGVFRASALRGQALPEPWLQANSDGSLAAEPVLRRCVRFRVGNALDPMLLRSEAPFDVVFCRNLLIYLAPAARTQLMQTLLSAARTPALVLAGQAEVLSALADSLSPYERGCPLSFVHGQPRPAEKAPAVRATLPRPAPVARAKPQKQEPALAMPVPVAVPAPQQDTLARAHALADAGHVADAHRACLEHLGRHPTDVAALFLLGLLESAAGNVDAADRAFTQVLYLDREHLDAIQQRVGLAERRGAGDQARELRARAARLRRQRNEAAP